MHREAGLLMMYDLDGTPLTKLGYEMEKLFKVESVFKPGERLPIAHQCQKI